MGVNGSRTSLRFVCAPGKRGGVRGGAYGRSLPPGGVEGWAFGAEERWAAAVPQPRRWTPAGKSLVPSHLFAVTSFLQRGVRFVVTEANSSLDFPGAEGSLDRRYRFFSSSLPCLLLCAPS